MVLVNLCNQRLKKIKIFVVLSHKGFHVHLVFSCVDVMMMMMMLSIDKFNYYPIRVIYFFFH